MMGLASQTFMPLQEPTWERWVGGWVGGWVGRGGRGGWNELQLVVYG